MNPEVGRKLIHLVAILIPGLSYIFPRYVIIIVLGIITFIFIFFDILRLKLPLVKGIFIILFGSMLRKKELNSLTGGTYLFLSSFVASLIFSKPIYMASISYLVVGDTFAAIVGQTLGRVKLVSGKTLEGTLAFILSCLPIAYVISLLRFSIEVPLFVLIIGVVVAAVAEMLPSVVNDNVVIPISSGISMQLIYILLK